MTIQLESISHQFGDLAVIDDVSIELYDGEFVAIIGPSGCGKSTLLRILTGLLNPSTGRVLHDDRVITGKTGEVGYLPQGDSLLPWLRAIDNASLGLEASGMSPNDARAKARQLFETFGLGGFEQSWPHELSGGMRQRVAVLRTFLLPHPTLALDEPFGALDAITRRQIQTWMRNVWLQDRRTTMLITHDIEEALLLADRVLVMSPRPGRIATSVSVDLDDNRLMGIETSAKFVALKTSLINALMSDAHTEF